MIVYFADRHMNILGNASTTLPEGLLIVDDEKTEEIEAGVSVLELHIAYDALTRKKVERCAAVGKYLLYQSGDKKSFYTIIETEADTKSREVMVYAEDAGLDLLNEIAFPYAADKESMFEHYVSYFCGDCGVEIGLSDISTSKKLSWNDEQTVTERLLDVAKEFNAEISFSFDIEGMSVLHKYINIFQKRGKDDGVQLRLNRDIDRMVTKKSIANLATALLAYGSTPEDSDIAVNLKDYKYDDGDFYVDGNLLKSRKAWEGWSRYTTDGKEKNNGDIVKTFNYDTVSQKLLCEKAIEELRKIRSPEVNYEIDVINLPDGTKIGDTVNIVDDAGEVYFSARILKTEISEVRNSVSVTIGDYLIKDNGTSQQVQELAGSFKDLAANRTLYTWTAYADDEYGSGISLDPSGKSYLGTRTNQTVRDPDISNPELYKWVRIKGEEGEAAVLLHIESSRGSVFKNNAVSTVLSVVIYHGKERIEDAETLRKTFGSGAYIQWKWQRLEEETYGIISSGDPRIRNDGFSFALSPDDVDVKVTFLCELIV